MFSLLKSQIIKPFLQFTKNLSADQLQLSIMKGEGRLNSLELNEATIMNLLNLPTWLNLRKACGSGISFKIRWTKLDSRPVVVIIDEINVEIEALSVPRPDTDNVQSSYRTGTGKYKLADKVVDGATVLINTINVRFFAPAFNASVEISRVSLVSKTPSWGDGALHMTLLTFPAVDAVLLYKQLTWDSIRIVADGLLNELCGIPVKLITNTGRIRLTMKKRLSDASLVTTKSQFLLDDLLWVLTLSQVEACIIFLRSLQQSISLASEQRKLFAASRAKRQTLSSSIKGTHVSNQSGNSGLKDPQSAAAKMFSLHDIVETSYHMCLRRTEIHFCDETRYESSVGSLPNGYIQVHLYDAEINWYPYHLDISPKIRWSGCREFQHARDAWLNRNTAYSLQDRFWREYRDRRASNPDSANLRPSGAVDPYFSLIQNVTVLRLADLDVSLVSFPGSTRKVNSCRRDTSKDCDEVPLHKNLFIASDKKLLCLPPNTYLLTIEHRSAYRPLSEHSDEDSANVVSAPVPCVLFGQLNPMFVRFDPDTVMWLNTFLLTLQQNLDIFVKYQELWTSDGHPHEQKCYHIRGEALMPRIILPVNTLSGSTVSVEGSLPSPDVLVIQCDEVIVQLLVSPLPVSIVNAINCLPKPSAAEFNDPRPKGRPAHIPVDASIFDQLLSDTTLITFNETFWCLHIPHAWAEFLIVQPQSTEQIRSSVPCDQLHPAIYRQSVLEAVPLTLWAQLSFLPDVGSHMEVLADFNCTPHFLDSSADSVNEIDSTVADEPIVVLLGAYPTLNSTQESTGAPFSSYPVAADHLLLIVYLLHQLSHVVDHITLENLLSVSRKTQPLTDKELFTPLCLIRCIQSKRCIELRLFLPDEKCTNVVTVNTSEPTDAISENGCGSLSQSNLSTSEKVSASVLANRRNQSSPNLDRSHEWKAVLERWTTSSGSLRASDSSGGDSLGSSVAISSLNDWADIQWTTHNVNVDDRDELLSLASTADNLPTVSLKSYPSIETGVEVLVSDWYLDPTVASSAVAAKNPSIQSVHTVEGRETIIRNRPDYFTFSASNPDICLRIHEVTVVADLSCAESRAWLNFRRLDIVHRSVLYSGSEENHLWSLFGSSTSSITGVHDSNPRLHNDIHLVGDLLADWTVKLPPKLCSSVLQLMRLISERPSLIPTGRLFDGSVTHFGPSTSKIFATVDLNQSHLEVNFEDTRDSTAGNALRMVCLDRGLVMRYVDGVLHIGHASQQHNENVSSSSHTGNDPTSSPTAQSLHDEVALLRAKVHQLNTEISRLQLELTVRNADPMSSP